MKEYKKKGQMGGIVGGVISLIAGVGVATLVLIFVGVLGGQTYNLVEDDIAEIGNTTVSSDTFTALKSTAVALDHDYIHTSSFKAYVTANNSLVPASNYTLNSVSGTFTLTDSVYNNTGLTSNYTYGDLSIQNSVKAGITSGFEALEQTGTYLPIIVLAIVISVVLVLVLGMNNIASGNTGKSSIL